VSQANYKSTRLLVEAVNREMESVRKAAMGNMALGSLNELRDLVAQLVKKAERVALEDLTGMSESDPAEYVAAMMPFVAEYHRQLAPRDLLAPCLCRDLRLLACVVILVGEDKSTVKAAHDPARPDAALIVETLLTSLDGGAKQVASAYEGIDLKEAEPVQYKTAPLTVEILEEGIAEVLRNDGSEQEPEMEDEDGRG
jgi:hypothetical protein